MGVIDRVSRLVRANVNDLLDQAEDPEIMIDQILRDMESNIADGRKQVEIVRIRQAVIEQHHVERFASRNCSNGALGIAGLHHCMA